MLALEFLDVELSLKKMLSEANSIGADWTKVQIYNFESLVAEDNEIFKDSDTMVDSLTQLIAKKEIKIFQL